MDINYENIYFIVIDGTVEIVQSYGDKITNFISEKDKCIYAGLNHGIELVTGDVVEFLHSDDIYPSHTIIEEITQQFESDESLDGVYVTIPFSSISQTPWFGTSILFLSVFIKRVKELKV